MLGSLLLAPLCLALTAGCASDLDCSLNGECTAGTCKCEPAWEGAQCERFAQLPVAEGMDIKEPNVTTWGGSPLHRKLDGKYHMYVAEMVGNCGITTWQTNSQVVHFTADAPLGPWERADVAVPVWSHCPSAAAAPNGTVVMWAFTGQKTPKTGEDAWGKACTGGASPCGFAKHGCNSGPSPAPKPPTPPTPPYPAPTPGPRPGPVGNMCAFFAPAAGFACRPATCLSDGARSSGHCGVSALCPNASASPFCAPLGNGNRSCRENYAQCSAVAAERCRKEPRCHGFALYRSFWRGGRAQFFGKGQGGEVPQRDWTAFVVNQSASVSHSALGSASGLAPVPLYAPALTLAPAPWQPLSATNNNSKNNYNNMKKPRHAEMVTTTSRLPLLVSDSGDGRGPWRAFAAVIEEEVSYSIAAPWFLDNGTAFWVLQSTCPASVCPHGCKGTCGTVLRGETWRGPYRVLARGACSLGEDHSMYVDARGRFHCITHRFSDSATDPAGPYDATRDGGHAFSPDGSDPWYCADGTGGHGACTLQSPVAYNSTIVYAKNGVHEYGTRERPHVLFGPAPAPAPAPDPDADAAPASVSAAISSRAPVGTATTHGGGGMGAAAASAPLTVVQVPVALVTSAQHCQAPDVPDACVKSDPHSCNQSNIPCRNYWPGYMDRAFTSIVPLGTE